MTVRLPETVDDKEMALLLRQRAEEKFRAYEAATTEDLSPEQAKQLFHELRVHQIELEMQNEELRRVQRELDSARTRYFDLYDLAPVGYLAMNEQGVVQEANLTAAVMFGAKRINLLKHSLTRFILHEDQDSYYLHRKKLFANGEPQVCELRLLKVDGTKFWAHLTATLALAEEGHMECRLVLTDITELKRMIDEKTELESQLQQARKMEAIGCLAGGVAHDFNNMLGVIIGHAELALATIDPSHPLHERLTEIHKSAEHSAALTRQLIAFARKELIVPEVLDLNKTVAGMASMLKRLIRENIELRFKLAEDLWLVRVDPSQVEQIIFNLCVNARNAIAHSGRITVVTENIVLDQEWCAARPGAVPGEYVAVKVTDNGCGMDGEILERIFEPFYTTRGFGEGTGMGLASVYGIAKQNQGFIDVISRPGWGSTFTVYLPRHRGNLEEPLPQPAAKPESRGSETILLVEDEPVLLELASQMLESQGYTVIKSASPLEAMRLFGEHADDISLLLTDVIMPGMTGKEIATKLCSLKPDLKCLYMSGYTNDIIADKGELKKEDNFIQKPFTLAALTAKLREVLEGPAL